MGRKVVLFLEDRHPNVPTKVETNTSGPGDTPRELVPAAVSCIAARSGIVVVQPPRRDARLCAWRLYCFSADAGTYDRSGSGGSLVARQSAGCGCGNMA